MKFKWNQINKGRFFSSIDEAQWNRWAWQLQNRLETKTEFEKHMPLSESEAQAFDQNEKGVGPESKKTPSFKVSVTPYYLSLINTDDPNDPIRKILMPQQLELAEQPAQAMLDPLAEDIHSPEKCLIHRYSDRVLFLVTDICSVYCRYCTRKRFTGQDQGLVDRAEYTEALNYIQSRKGIREVILSGGDPLTLSNSVLDRIFSDLRKIEHVEIIRVGSRMPVVCPMRVDQELVSIFKKHKPIYLMTHFNHPRELTLETTKALELVVDHGVPVFNQMVLLNGVNNHPAIVQALSRRLLYLRVKPYYMFQCDPSEGTDHLRTSVENSLWVQREMWGHMSGLAMPNLALDIPDGGGKAYLVPDFEMDRSPEVKGLIGESGQKNSAKTTRVFKGWDGRVGRYINPLQAMVEPSDVELYLKEWEEIKSARVLRTSPQIFEETYRQREL